MEMLKDGDASSWVMNDSADTRVHICHRGWMKGANKSIEKRIQVLHLVGFMPCSLSNILVIFYLTIKKRSLGSLFLSF